MSANNLDRQPEERLITEIRELKRQLSEIRTLQSQGMNSVPILLYPLASFSRTVAAGSTQFATLAYRHSVPNDLTTDWRRIFEPALTVYVDNNEDDAYRWPFGGFLSAGQCKLMSSVVRDPEYGTTPQDPGNTAVYHVQLLNLDSVSHTYYCTLSLYASPETYPFTEM